MSDNIKGRDQAGADLVATLIVAVAYFGYLLSCVDLPQLFARPVLRGHILPWGIVGGIAVVVLIMAMAGLYMVLRNRSDVDRADEETLS
jgi:uncharacterized membrane protein (DUF485 family)